MKTKMLKPVFVISLVLGVVTTHHESFVSRSHQQHIHFQQPTDVKDMNVMDIITRNGYPAEKYTVRTRDGYLLDLFRIPDKRPRSSFDNQPSDESSQQNNNKTQNSSFRKRTMLLLPGMVSNAEDFVMGGREQGLAFFLADREFDVFLGNVRGSKYGRKHTTLNPDRDPQFWNFCWEDIALNDLSAIIDAVMDITKNDELSYLGHMQGSTIFYVLASMRPEYNRIVRKMISLGPIAFLSRTENMMLRLASKKLYSEGWIVRNFGRNEFTPSTEAIDEGGYRWCMEMKDEMFCERPFFLLNGFNSNHLNDTTVWPIVTDMNRPTGTSTKSILHYGELVKNGRFTSTNGQDFPLERINTTMAVFYTDNDMTTSQEDIDKLARHLNLYQLVKMEGLTNNLDLLFGNNVVTIVYERIFGVLEN